MNGPLPPPLPTAPAKKSGMPTWAIVAIVLGVVGIVGVFIIGMLAAIAIPNFVKARNTAQMNACINNLRMIDGAKQQWALTNAKAAESMPTAQNLAPVFKNGVMPRCPAGGVYTIGIVKTPPSCSVAGHTLSPSN